MVVPYESVSKLVRVRQGRTTVTFEIVGKDLLVEYQGQRQHVKFTIRENTVGVLKELLGGVPYRGPLPVGPTEPSERPPGSVPKGGHEGTPTTGRESGIEGLEKQADGVVEGMG